MKTVEEIRAAIQAAVPGAGVEIISNPSPSGQHSLLIAHSHALQVAQFLRDDAELALDFLSNVTGVDWLDKEISEKVKVTRTVTKTVDGVEQQVEETVDETRKRVEPGYLESVYHLFSVAKKHGPVIIRMRTGNRTDQVEMPSLTPIWRGAELQEREDGILANDPDDHDQAGIASYVEGRMRDEHGDIGSGDTQYGQENDQCCYPQVSEKEQDDCEDQQA